MKLTRLKSDRPRRARDFYPTPYGLAESALEYMSLRFPEPSIVLDPGCGTGVWSIMAKELYGCYTIGVDLEKSTFPISIESRIDKFYLSDYTEWRPKINETPDWIVGNPPYGLMEEFIRHSFAIAPQAKVVFLGRLEFLGSSKRAHDLFRNHPLTEVLVLPRRPSFFSVSGKGKTTDAMEYALYIWNGNRSVTAKPTLDWLDWEYNGYDR